MNTNSMILFLAILLVAPEPRASVAVPDVIGNAMVLQRDLVVPIWGKEDPGEPVVVQFSSKTPHDTVVYDSK